MATSIYLRIEPEERQALDELCRRDLRDLQQQVRWIVREHLEREGVLQVQAAPAGEVKQYEPA